MNQNRRTAGLVILIAVFTILATSGAIILLQEWRSGPQVNHRVPIPSLRYCSSNQVKPCLLSFTTDSNGDMVINLLTTSSAPADFYIKVKHQAGESLYQCRKVRGFPTNIACTGEALPPGEALQFLMISNEEDILLAEGSFPIIGLAVATPEIAMTPTPRIRLTPPYR